MTAKIIDGKAIAANIRQQVKQEVNQRLLNGLSTPGLDVILIGDNHASATYVKHKQRACQEVGILSRCHHLAADVDQNTLHALIQQLNDNPDTNGILLQLPLPAHLNPEDFIEHIDPDKDVDGFHPFNYGKLALRIPRLRPCTPFGVITLLQSTGVNLMGKHAVVVGASNIVGRPMALELLLQKCTVTICHSYTQDLATHIQNADILISATGVPGVIDSEWIKPGAICIDIGFSRLENNKIVGDLDFESASKRASWITPVPGGVGPMTVATLLQNTLKAAELQDEK